MEDKNIATILDSLAEVIQKLKLDIYLKELHIERLMAENAELKGTTTEGKNETL